MIPSDFLPHSAVWQQPTKTQDGHGSDVYTYSGGTAVRGWFQQRTTEELVGGRQTVVTQWWLFLNEQGVGPLDRFVWDGKTFQVDGDPAPLSAPTGFHHLEIPLRRVTG